ncbi:MAG TPA: universal stress protein [Chloroflexota bacterium]|nr:universal stress protein [Chloroflexota bacterium]
MAKRILVPLDGTPLGEAVLPHVAELARALDADVELLHVVPPSFVASRGGGPRQPPSALLGAPTVLPAYSPSSTVLRNYQADPTEVEQTRKYVERVAAWLRQEGLRATARVVEGPDVAETILRHAESADMLALAASSERLGFNVERFVRGSVAERLIHAARTPILLVRVGDAAG